MGQHSRQLNHHQARESGRIQWNLIMHTLEQKHLVMTKTRSNPNKSSELLISLSIQERRDFLAQRTYLWSSAQHSTQPNHQKGRVSNPIHWNLLVLNLEQTHLTITQTHSNPNKISELLILMSCKRKRDSPAQRTYLWSSAQHSTQPNHHQGRESNKIHWNLLVLNLEQTHLTITQTHSNPNKISELLILMSSKGRRDSPDKRTYLWS